MKRLFLIPIAIMFLLQACKNRSERIYHKPKDILGVTQSGTTFSNDITYQHEQQHLARKRSLCKQLALYDIQHAESEFELRMWKIPSMWDPSILYILRKSDSAWTLFHYQYYTLRSTDMIHYYDNPIVDSIIMRTVRPQNTSWETYIQNLHLDSLWNLKTESAIKSKSFDVVDGHVYLLEIRKKSKYKYIYLTFPDLFKDKDINHKRFVEFRKSLIEPIIYNGMINP